MGGGSRKEGIKMIGMHIIKLIYMKILELRRSIKIANNIWWQGVF